MAEKKMTKKDWFTAIEDVILNSNAENKASMLEFIDHELELLDHKNRTRSTAQTPTQKANVAIMETIVDTLTEMGTAASIPEMKEYNSALSDLTPQKISALLHKLIEDGKVERIMDKKRAYYKVC